MAKVALVYPKIPDSREIPEGQCIAFEKYDGTNMHWVWERELGWYAFGVRRKRYDLDGRGMEEFAAEHAEIAEAPECFLRDNADEIERVFRTHPDYQGDEFTAFTEFLGARSFAGRHKADDPKHLVLFDVGAGEAGKLQIENSKSQINSNQRENSKSEAEGREEGDRNRAGLVGPEQFVEDFGECHAARVVYEGKLTGAFVRDVREGKYDTAEGVVCKGLDKKTGEVLMVKIKTTAYMERLKEAFAEDWEKYWE